MSKKMGKRLMGICGVAVTAIYTAGYVYTMPSAQASASSTPPFSTSTSSSASTAASTNNTSFSSGSHQGTKSNSASTTTSKKSNKGASTNQSTQSGSSAQKSKSSSTSSSTSSKPKAAAKAKYKDGTYTGSGSNPYGTLSVSLNIQNGKISAVNITQYMMHYPQSFIDPQLPKEVVSMQTWRIYIVSGATASTYNFAEAVYAALKKAKA